jgi:hypothetical protein
MLSTHFNTPAPAKSLNLFQIPAASWLAGALERGTMESGINIGGAVCSERF